MGKTGKLRKRNRRTNLGRSRVHLIVNNNNKILRYHIFIFEGKTIACIEDVSGDSYDYSFVESGLNVIEYAKFISKQPGIKENMKDDDIEASISKLKCRIISDLKVLAAETVNEYLHYIYEVLDCSKKIIKV